MIVMTAVAHSDTCIPSRRPEFRGAPQVARSMLSRIVMKDRSPGGRWPRDRRRVLYVGDVVSGVYSAANSAWNKLP